MLPFCRRETEAWRDKNTLPRNLNLSPWSQNIEPRVLIPFPQWFHTLWDCYHHLFNWSWKSLIKYEIPLKKEKNHMESIWKYWYNHFPHPTSFLQNELLHPEVAQRMLVRNQIQHFVFMRAYLWGEGIMFIAFIRFKKESVT